MNCVIISHIPPKKYNLNWHKKSDEYTIARHIIGKKSFINLFFLTLQTNLCWKREKNKKFLTFHTADPPLFCRVNECVFFCKCIFLFVDTCLFRDLNSRRRTNKSSELEVLCFLHRKEDCSCEFHHKSQVLCIETCGDENKNIHLPFTAVRNKKASHRRTRHIVLVTHNKI